MAKTFPASKFEPAVRRNWGYWDGVAARQLGIAKPMWQAHAWQTRPAHPFDKPYGEGYWVGYYGEEAPAGANG